MVQHACHLITSYFQLTGLSLTSTPQQASKHPEDACRKLFMEDKLIVLSHGVQIGSTGPVLNYGNSAALARVTSQGLARGVNGVRIDFLRRRFLIQDATVWNIVINGKYLGQAACFDKWTLL
jgi:hypothetical protein